MSKVDNMYEISLLLDFYGQLLTQRQYEILDLHYNNDLSLGEIAEQMEITRQGVYDNIKRGKNLLNEYESKLGLVRRFSGQKSKAREILNIIRSIDRNGMKKEDADKLTKAEEGILDIINNY